MELNSIKEAFERVTKKQKLSECASLEVIDQLSLEIEEALSKIQSGSNPSSEYRVILNEVKTKLNEIAPLRKLEGPQKELNISLSKFQKLLEKTFHTDISKVYKNVDPDTDTLNQTIANHLYREGLFHVGDCFVNEASEGKVDAMRAPFVELHRIREAMKSGNLDPALSWVCTNRENLIRKGSDLELQLRRMQYVEIVKNKDQREDALKYLREFLSPLASSHINEISKLTACLLWVGKLDSSPYSPLLSPWHLIHCVNDFTRQYCNIFLGQSYESPLSVTVSAGFQGLPTLLKMMNVMIGRKQEWQAMKQLPVPMDLDDEFQFHSIFVCPVSKDQASDENPVMLLTCGHVLCKQTITKLSKNNSTRPFKCPYCPTEVEVGKCRQLHF